MGYDEPIEISKYQKFQYIRQMLQKDGINIPLPTGSLRHRTRNDGWRIRASKPQWRPPRSLPLRADSAGFWTAEVLARMMPDARAIPCDPLAGR
jgi:hypothetical protein